MTTTPANDSIRLPIEASKDANHFYYAVEGFHGPDSIFVKVDATTPAR